MNVFDLCPRPKGVRVSSLLVSVQEGSESPSQRNIKALCPPPPAFFNVPNFDELKVKFFNSDRSFVEKPSLPSRDRGKETQRFIWDCVNTTYFVSMLLIRDVVQQTLTTGYLSVEAEERLRQLLKTKYDKDDLKAFMMLQKAAMDGFVKQESVGLSCCQQLTMETNL